LRDIVRDRLRRSINVVTRAPGFPTVILKVGSLDDPKVFASKMAIYTCDKQPFHTIPEGVRAFERGSHPLHSGNYRCRSIGA
jgi:hypothetical protein